MKLLYVNQYFPELFFVGAATAEPEAPVPGRPDYLKPRYLADRITLVAILMGERMKIRRMDVKMK